jgi:hypothetical protein
MTYYTAVYQPINEFILDEPCVYLNDDTGFYVHIWHGRYFLVKNKLLISELVNGQESLDKNYKGSFEFWIEKVKQKDVKKVKKLNEYIDQIKEDLQTIENVWKIT